MTGGVKRTLMEEAGVPVELMTSLDSAGEEFERAVSGTGGNGNGEIGGGIYHIQDEHNTPTQTVLYELPVLWEEIEAFFVLEMELDTLDLLRVQVMTLLGVCHIFSNKLGSAGKEISK